MFEADRFVGLTGKARLLEMYPFFQKGHPDDLKEAVTMVIKNLDKTYKVFPSVAYIKKRFQAAARIRRDRTLKLEELATPVDRDKVARIIRKAGFTPLADVRSKKRGIV